MLPHCLAPVFTCLASLGHGCVCLRSKKTIVGTGEVCGIYSQQIETMTPPHATGCACFFFSPVAGKRTNRVFSRSSLLGRLTHQVSHLHGEGEGLVKSHVWPSPKSNSRNILYVCTYSLFFSLQLAHTSEGTAGRTPRAGSSLTQASWPWQSTPTAPLQRKASLPTSPSSKELFQRVSWHTLQNPPRKKHLKSDRWGCQGGWITGRQRTLVHKWDDWGRNVNLFSERKL